MLVSETSSVSWWRGGLVLGPGLVASFLALAAFAAVPQNLAYHEFADQRVLYGIPHVWNVVSNLPFAVIGLLGCWWIIRQARMLQAFEAPYERIAYLVFFVGEFLTCFGSGYYHSGPSNETLVWDRLVFSLMLTSMFAIVVTEFVDRHVGRAMLVPVVLLGVASVLYWWDTEMQGTGDVRFYAVIQFYPVVVMPIIFLLCRSRYTHARLFALVWGLYAIAKVAELYDREVFEWSGIVSGHTLKHFVAAGASYIPLYALQRRAPLNAGDLPRRTIAPVEIVDARVNRSCGADNYPRSRVAARRWGVIVTIFYAVVVLALLIPGVFMLQGQPWREAYTEMYGDGGPVPWVWAAVLITGQALLFVRVDRSWAKPRPRARIAVTAMAMSFATALLFLCIATSLLAAVYGDDWPRPLRRPVLEPRNHLARLMDAVEHCLLLLLPRIAGTDGDRRPVVGNGQHPRAAGCGTGARPRPAEG